MVHGCGDNLVKFVFFFLNLLICILGLLLTGFSLFANLAKNFAETIRELVHKLDPEEQLPDLGRYQASLWILLAVGSLLLIIGFLGCCGAVCESPVFLSLYFFIVLVLTLLEGAAAVYAVTNRDSFKNTVHELFLECDKVEKCYNSLKPIEDIFKCCGTTKESQHKFPCQNEGLPDCETAITGYIEGNIQKVGLVIMIHLVINLVTLIFTYILIRASRRERYAGYYA